jgi:hypothetical protein
MAKYIVPSNMLSYRYFPKNWNILNIKLDLPILLQEYFRMFLADDSRSRYVNRKQMTFRVYWQYEGSQSFLQEGLHN